ncbi:HIT family protein [Methanobacterium ferruginis]|uniref:HIT family protein n=1 Tax=Methanobacterium ferruginis TaxID=710191 RepID=UPI0025744B02|nr:HIT family protein [Methanobacterium ferruginis]BDZ66667.1 HIT family protein [Methanobacterium ferruginis]
MDLSCEYCQISGGYGKLIWETAHWNIYLAPSQRYLGTGVVALKRHCQDLSQVKDEEWIDFASVVRKLEKSLDESFHPTLYNWSCFKNAVFRNKTPNPEIHWHFIPRYSDPVDFEGIHFQDPDFGHIPLPIKKEVPEEIMEKLAIKIMENLEKIEK